jgi:hypothetical protein
MLRVNILIGKSVVKIKIPRINCDSKDYFIAGLGLEPMIRSRADYEPA